MQTNYFLNYLSINTRSLFLGAFCLIIPFLSEAQTGFYVRASGGYSFQASKTAFNDADPLGITGIEPSTDIRVNAIGETRVQSLQGTVGGGYKLTLAGGYMFNLYIGAELGINYFNGTEELIGRLETPTFFSEVTTQIEGFDITPAIVLTPGLAGLNPYARIGLFLTATGDLKLNTYVRDDNFQDTSVPVEIRAESEVQPQFSIGYLGALGALYPINEQISIMAEVEIKSFTLKSNEAKIISYRTTSQGEEVPGQQLADLPIRDKQFDFSDDFVESENPDPNEPRTLPTQFVNANGIGFNLGLWYKF